MTTQINVKKFFFPGNEPLNQLIDELDRILRGMQIEGTEFGSMTLRDASGGKLVPGDLVSKAAADAVGLANASALATKALGVCTLVNRDGIKFNVAKCKTRVNLIVGSNPSVADPIFLSTTAGKGTLTPEVGVDKLRQFVGIVSSKLTNEDVEVYLDIDFMPEVFEWDA